MRKSYFAAALQAASRVVCLLPFAVGLVFGQSVNLSVGATSTTLPDGTSVPMWGYSCGTAVTATCAPLSPAGGWSPVLITAGPGSLTINLTNNLTFTAGSTTNSIPTSLVIVGQLGGGLGKDRSTTIAPDHKTAQAATTWPIAGGPPGTPPPQGPRVQSFATEVPATTPATTTPLTWSNLRPGTYLIESGTHPSIQGPMGLYGVLVVTTPPAGTTAGTAYPGVTYNAEVPLLMSEIDPVQNNAVQAAVTNSQFSETAVWSGQPNGCGNPASPSYQSCYPPVVNYSPLYYLFNGVAFNKTNASASLFGATPNTSPVSGNLLVRFVNAGLRMHVPSIVGATTTITAPSSTPPTAVVGGFSLIAEDGNPLPGIPRVQNEVFLAPGKTYDVMMNIPTVPTAPKESAPTLPAPIPVFDRQLSLSGNATARDSGMLAYIGVNGSGAPVPGAGGIGSALAKDDTYNSIVAGQVLTVSDPAKGVIANDFNVFGVQASTQPGHGSVVLSTNGTFTYSPDSTWTASNSFSDSFIYCGNGATPTTSPASCATVHLGAATIEGAAGITVNPDLFTSKVATFLSIKSPGILANDTDGAGYPLTVKGATLQAPLAIALTGPGSGTATVDPNGGFNATVSAPGTYSFTYYAQNSQGTSSSSAATVTLTFPAGSNLKVSVVDGGTKTAIRDDDYRWIIEEDRTFYVDPYNTTNIGGTNIVPTFGTNFHTSYMPVIATGCTGPISCQSGQTVLNQASVCDIGNGVCRLGTQQTAVDPGSVYLDPTKRYYISVLPGDAATPFITANASGGHGMGGAPIAAGQTAVTVLAQPTPFPPAKLAVFVFEDDFPLNGEQDGGGGIDVLSPNEPGLGSFNIQIMDDAGGPGDPTGQVNYDMFNQPLANSLSGMLDPATGWDACPISKNARKASDATSTGITGVIVTCPKYESDGKTLSPLAGQATIVNLMPGRYGVIATPAADRIARGEEWLQTNTLDGQKAHDSFLRIGEPNYFQEYGPAGWHVKIGFANPAIINSRLKGVCAGSDANITGASCTNTLTGKVTTERMSRTPDERLYDSGTRDSFAFSQCYVSFGDPDGEDFAFTKCNADGTFSMSGLPDGDWRITTFDQWNDQLVDGLSTPVRLDHTKSSSGQMGNIAANQWQANIMTRTFLDDGDGVSQKKEPGLALVKTNVRFRDGSFSNRNNTDLNGYANFNEEFPLFSWYVVETDVTRYKNTGTHVVYDAGGPADGTPCGSAAGTAPCGNSIIGKNLANTVEQFSLPANLRVPGAVYCDNADCQGFSVANGPASSATMNLSTGRIDPPWVLTEAWQGFSGQNNFLEFGKKPYAPAQNDAPAENGGIRGHVVYSSTRPFDDPQFGTQNVWEPLVPNVTINLYQEGFAADGVTPTLTLIDHTTTSSFDDWAQGFRSDGIPNMNCPGQATGSGPGSDPFFYSLYNQPQWLDIYNTQHATPAGTTTPLPANSQYKCYDGMHNWNQLQPAPYDGMYQFPSVTGLDPNTGKPTGTNCLACTKNPDTSDPYRSGAPMLPAGKYVVEVVVPPGYELVKEEDKNILIGDNFIAPATVEFANLGSAIFILPDQAEVASSYNANNPQNSTNSLGRVQTLVSHEGDTPTVDTFWPCVGAARTVPDFISLFPNSKEVAPFAGATRNLCDRKEVTLSNQESEQAEFFVFTETHAAAHFTGVITDDFTSEFDPFSPQFGEKFAPAHLPVAIKDWAGNEISRVYADQWGSYDGLTYSTWEVNPPNPTGYSPTMMITCMNDKGPIPGPNGTMITDPLFNPAYSNFCYEIPFMPGATQYMDTPVTPTSAFAGAGYNNPDCAYPGGTASAPGTPAIKEVDGDSGVGPWVPGDSNSHKLTITALGDQTVTNHEYSGPAATTAPYNQKTVPRHYGFGSTKGTVTIADLLGRGGDYVVPASNISWTDSQIVLTLPSINTSPNIPVCPLQQQQQYGGPNGSSAFPFARCGQLVIKTANGNSSVDTVTVTVGGKAPTHIAATDSVQAKIDAASPGDLLILDPASTGPATHSELLLMWKPVRLQGVGAASSIIDANAHPAGKLDGWRQRVDCLFGLATNGSPITTGNPFDPTGGSTCGSTNGTAWNYFNAFDGKNPQVDRQPLEATVGWDANLNGNLAEMLQEPGLMGALEGAGITVLSKGVNFPSNPFDPSLAAGFPTGTTLLTAKSQGCAQNATTNPFPSNFHCNPSSIDGLTVTNSSQGGGGIFVHGWGHNLQIANNRVQNNSGTLSGGINVGQGEFPPGYFQGSTTNAAPGSCYTAAQFGPVARNTELPYCHDLNVNVHHNAISLNASTGDELFSATPAGAGGISFCTGTDNYKFNYNWVCGNLSTGDGGGVGHIGFIWNGDIEHNSILFNQSTNPTIAANGGGLLIYGAPDVDPPCGATTDADCLAPANTISPSDGVGPNLTINANLIMGNAAESGSGGGLRMANVNGTDVVNFALQPGQWYSPLVTNNIIVNNVAGWDGAGISLQDALSVNIINNTIMSNDTTASSGVLFNTLGAPLASSQGPCAGPRDNTGVCTVPWTTSMPQPAGLVTMQNSAVLTANLPGTVVCPDGHYQPGTGSTSFLPRVNASCRSYSYPFLYNDLFWQNRSFYISVTGQGTGTKNQQNLVALEDAGTSAQPTSQTSTGQCPADPNVYYWDIGVRGDTGHSNHSGGSLAPHYSVLTNASDYPGMNNLASNPNVLSQYCNGSRVPPEFGGTGYLVPPGISDATVPNPVFSLTPAATVDEGNNWINISWGPLALYGPNAVTPLGNYAIPSNSPAVNRGTSHAPINVAWPTSDFFGNNRTPPNDIGAVEPAFVPYSAASVAPTSLAFGTWATGTTSSPLSVTVTNTGNTNLTGGTFPVSGAPFSIASGGTCTGRLAIGGTCTINVQFKPTTVGPAPAGKLTIAYAGATVSGTPVALSGTGANMAVTPASLNFADVVSGTTSAQTLTVRNSSGSSRPLTITVGGPGFSRQGGSCTTNLGNNSSCTINIVYTAPAATTTSNGTVTITPGGTPSAAVANSPVSLSGNSVPQVVSANLTPTSWSPQQARNCPGTGGRGVLACSMDPAQAFTLTNTGNVNLTGIGHGALAGTNTADYTIITQFSNCGNSGSTTLAPGGTCTVVVQFKPLTAEPAAIKNATLNVTDVAGTQTSTLAGNAQ